MNTPTTYSRSASLLATTILAVQLAACSDALLAPEVSDPDPQFLIGGSPLAPITLDKSGVLTVSVTVNKGPTKVTDEDRFVLRVAGELRLPDGSMAGAINPKVDPVTDENDLALRDGSDVGFIMDMDIPAPTWDRIKDQDEVKVELLAELVLVTKSGAEQVLDAVRLAGIVDPKNDPRS